MVRVQEHRAPSRLSCPEKLVTKSSVPGTKKFLGRGRTTPALRGVETALGNLWRLVFGVVRVLVSEFWQPALEGMLAVRLFQMVAEPCDDEGCALRCVSNRASGRTTVTLTGARMVSPEASLLGARLDEHHSPETNGRMAVCRRCGAQTNEPNGRQHVPHELRLGHSNAWLDMQIRLDAQKALLDRAKDSFKR